MVPLAEGTGPPQKVIQRLHVFVRGAVQGVGFRPFVYRLAARLGLPGWVTNSPQGVFLEVEGAPANLETFLLSLQAECPPPAVIQGMEHSFLDPVGFSLFEIRESRQEGEKTALLLPDIATCGDCLRDIFDPGNRRYLYPFTNCTHCGPRYTIIEALPYDRANTSMRSFTMCPECHREYEDPLNRRFHAQPNACPACGPWLELRGPNSEILGARQEALDSALQALKQGLIVAVKGVGGFHLMADAGSEEAVQRLRSRKHREEKPFGLMFPRLQSVREACCVTPLEERLLLSPEAPLVLLPKKQSPTDGVIKIAEGVAPGNPWLGVLLPYSPLHHLLLRAFQAPLVATSANLSEEPICTDEVEATLRLRGIADLFLAHNRRIVRHVDDSIVRLVQGREMVLRRARGYAPLPFAMKHPVAGVLAVGAHLKNSVSLGVGRNVFVSQHIGDLENRESMDAFHRVIDSFRGIYPGELKQIAADLHPDYLSTRYARQSGLPLLQIQHHFAHVAACIAENELEGEVLGVSWDGTGWGTDGTIWGGEFLIARGGIYRRFASLRAFRLPGSSQAVREPRRSALGLLHALSGESLDDWKDIPTFAAFSSEEYKVLRGMLQNGINSPLTSSMGRLFDALSSIVGLRQKASFEGQAAMELEYALRDPAREPSYRFRLLDVAGVEEELCYRLDWEPLFMDVLDDLKNGGKISAISASFHNALADMVVEVARLAAMKRVVLTGGCFQNRYLTERTIACLRAEGFQPYWHQRIPPNDGGISFGQAAAAGYLLAAEAL